jgi:superfamily II DNA or RNA helicase
MTHLNNWDDFILYTKNLSNSEKGELFEEITFRALKTLSIYKFYIKNVYSLRKGVPLNVRKHLNLPNIDEGIDLIAETIDNKYWAIQCKFKSNNQPPNVKELSTFNNLAHNYCKNIDYSLLFHTGERGVRKKHLLNEKYKEQGLDFWLSITTDEWKLIYNYNNINNVFYDVRTPREHQKDAISSANKFFYEKKNNRGKLIMPCGSGKSLTAFWIHMMSNSRRSVVIVPSLSLLKQTLNDWAREIVSLRKHTDSNFIVICGDETVSINGDEIYQDTSSFGFPTTTNIDEIDAFLKNNLSNNIIVFTTYHSAYKLGKVCKNRNIEFDFGIFDEAHKTVGYSDKHFSSLLFDNNMIIKKRMFMTATERVIKSSVEDILSMDDINIYGEIFYKLTFKKAIENNIITDYKIITVFISDTEINNIIKKHKYIRDEKNGIKEVNIQMLISAITHMKAMAKHKFKHTVSFHKSISAAKTFKSLYENIDKQKKRCSVFHVSSKQTAGERAETLKEFQISDNGLITNARCLTEGVDVPSIDCVLFADEKNSTIDIVQASGRALRKFTYKDTGQDKSHGYILIPLVLKEGTNLSNLSESDGFKNITKIITSLSTQDETIVEELKLINVIKNKTNSDKFVFINAIDKSINIDINSFVKNIETKLWEKIAKVNWQNFQDARSFVRTLKLKTYLDWKSYCNSGNKPLDIPYHPYRTYVNEWISWSDWLGSDVINNFEKSQNFLSVKEAKKYLKKYNNIITSQTIYNQWAKNNIKGIPPKPSNIPSAPWQTYKDDPEWKGLGDFLGTNRIAPRYINYISYDDAKNIIKKHKLKSQKEYFDWYEMNNIEFAKKGIIFPKYCNQTYKDEWEGWRIFLNSKNPHSKKNIDWLPFNKARNFVIKLKLKSTKEWYKYCRGELKHLPPPPENIPVFPHRTYKNDGYISYMDWLGKKEIKEKKKVMPFQKARMFARSLKLKDNNQWKKYIDGKIKDLPSLPENFPKHPILHYNKHPMWKGLGDFLGIENKFNIEYMPFEKARAFVLKLNLKSQKDWKIYCSSGEKPSSIPSNPNAIYADDGWINFGDWLGTGNLSTRDIIYLDYEKAKRIVRSIKLKTAKDYINWWRNEGHKLRPNIPAKPYRTYQDKGWTNWKAFLG